MAFQIPYPLVNGHRYSYASIEIRILDKIFFGFHAINYTNALSVGELYANAPHKIGRTRGRYEPTASAEMYRLEYENLKLQLAQLNGGQGYQEVPFDIIVAYAEQPSQPVVTDTIIGCRIVSSEFSNTEGTDPSMVSLELNVMAIKEAGIFPVVPLNISSV
jgi:hypothetical protein